MGNLNIYLLTFNCARKLVQPHEFAPIIFNALPQNGALPEIVVISIQEIAPIAYSFLGGSFLAPYFKALHDTVALVSKDHVNVIAKNLGLTAIMIFVKDVTKLSSIQSAGVGVGLQGMGNKGAVGVRFMFDEIQLTFVAAHLAPMEDALLRRNEDWSEIVKGMVFTANGKDRQDTRDGQDEDIPLLRSVAGQDASRSGLYSPRSHLFVAGDLNYRVSEVKPTAADCRLFPEPTDDMDSPRHFSNLLKRDQLLDQLQKRRTLHGLSEATIDFPPTYKLLAKTSGSQWNWATHRWPSWCDRILYLEAPNWMPEKITVHKYDALPQLETSDHRPVALLVSVPLSPLSEPTPGQDDIRLDPPFQVGSDWESRRALARRKEIAVGFAAYLSLTWEGNVLLLAISVGGIGAWLVIKSLLAFGTGR